MVTKSLLYKCTYQVIDSVDSLPKIVARDIGQLLVNIDRIWPLIDYKIKVGIMSKENDGDLLNSRKR